MHDALVRSKPAELLFVCHRALQRTEIGHDFLDGFADEPLRVKSGGFANELIAFAQGEGETGSNPAFIILQFCDGVGINWIFVDRVAAVAVADGETCVTRGNLLDHKSR